MPTRKRSKKIYTKKRNIRKQRKIKMHRSGRKSSVKSKPSST